MVMYSPRIDEELIPPLYRLAKARRVPMTRLVSGILKEALGSVDGEQVQASENGAGTTKGGERDGR
jgi:hypothetical protein